MDDKTYNDIQLLLRKGMEPKDIAYELEIPERLVFAVIRKKGSNAESKNRQTNN